MRAPRPSRPSLCEGLRPLRASRLLLRGVRESRARAHHGTRSCPFSAADGTRHMRFAHRLRIGQRRAPASAQQRGPLARPWAGVRPGTARTSAGADPHARATARRYAQAQGTARGEPANIHTRCWAPPTTLNRAKVSMCLLKSLCGAYKIEERAVRGPHREAGHELSESEWVWVCSHSSSHAPLLLATLFSHNIPLPRVH